MSPVNAHFAYITVTYYYLMNTSAIFGPSSGSKQIKEMYKTFVQVSSLGIADSAYVKHSSKLNICSMDIS
jgi:hypothetical protein